MNWKLFGVIVLLTGMSYFAGHGYGRQHVAETAVAAPVAVNSPSAHRHGHAGNAANEAATEAVWSAENAVAGEETTIHIRIQDEEGEPIQDFDISHEKLMHLIVVSKDLSYFDHIHPAYNGNGTFSTTTSFPAGGEYKLIADYVPTGGSPTTRTEWIEVKGTPAEAVPLVRDREHAKTADGVMVTLVNGHPISGSDFELVFQLADAETKEPVADLEPYLGAVGHVVILSEDTEEYLHVHPIDELASGPEARFATSFPEAGMYKVWAQFQRQGKVITVAYVVEAE
ncbi:hypothetical protein [Xylanibacillus composti]|uniref:Secreted protein n=1 Tax=Xylanibacillus composti TaxID=1572762 RepID=A0A8J4H6W9_9BACL|nr:hypothetical protein [Xylanibacillus composti]GIQ70801.1 hypothetical protein XYCOK13_36250 [Xylanibacillus composti]